MVDDKSLDWYLSMIPEVKKEDSPSKNDQGDCHTRHHNRSTDTASSATSWNIFSETKDVFYEIENIFSKMKNLFSEMKNIFSEMTILPSFWKEKYSFWNEKWHTIDLPCLASPSALTNPRQEKTHPLMIHLGKGAKKKIEKKPNKC